MHHPFARALALSLAVGVGGLAAAPAALAAAATPAHPRATAPVRLLACNGKTLVKPAGVFVISCADANSELSATKWKSWTATSAVGVTRFGLNLCNPYCAASKMSFFPGSTVRLSEPVTTKHGRLFSKLVVTYKLHGKTKSFPFSWKGDPGF